MVARKDPESNFISGIYNYCDRWCERCPMTERCLLFYQESKRRQKHLQEGKDPDDWEIMMEDVKANLQEAVELSETMIEDKSPVEIPERDFETRRAGIANHPLKVKAHKFAMDIHHFLERLSNFIHSEERSGVVAEELAPLQDAFEVLSWYHMQIAVKLDRALSGKVHPYTQDHKDSDGSAKVAYIGLTKSLDALTKAFESNQPMHREIMPLINTVYDLISEIDEEFPGHKKFKRPGFED